MIKVICLISFALFSGATASADPVCGKIVELSEIASGYMRIDLDTQKQISVQTTFGNTIVFLTTAMSGNLTVCFDNEQIVSMRK